MTEIKTSNKKIQKKLQLIWDFMVSDPKQALEDSRITEREAIEAGYTTGIRDSKLYQGWCLIYLSKLKEAIEILTDLSGNYKNDDESEAHINVFNALGTAYNDLGDRINAFCYYSLGLKLSRKAGLLNRELAIRSNMGSFYLENKNYSKALNHYKEILDKTDDSFEFLELKSVIMIDIGQCYYKLHRFDEADKSLLESRVISKKLNNLVNDADCLNQLCKMNYARGDVKQAKKYIDEALKLCRIIDNIRLECELYLMLGDIDDDFNYYLKTNELSRKINHKSAYMISCLKLGQHYEQMEDLKNALFYIKEHHDTEREINSIAAEKKFHNLEMEFEIERNKKNAELFQLQNKELKESLSWMNILNKIARETMSSLDIDSIFNTVYSNINLLMDAELFHVVFYDKEKDILNIVKVIENGNIIDPFAYTADEKKSFAGWSIKNQKEVLINDLDKEYSSYINSRAQYGSGPNTQSLITVPIFMRDNEIGAMAIQSYRKNAYKEEHAQLVKSLAAYLSIAFDNSNNYKKVLQLNKIILTEKEELEAANKKIMELATHDILTGLANRRVFYEMLEAALEQAKRRNEVLAVLFIDLDNFKPINDTWGHDIGDKVLIDIARRIKKAIRAADTIARIGGDEFLILLNPVKNKNEAKRVAEKVLEKIEAPLEIGEIKVSVGMSIGISICTNGKCSADKLIIDADSAMYKIKKGDKNGIGFYSED